MSIARAAVIGAGVMGAGVAQDLAQHGIGVILVDVDEATLEEARRAVATGLRLQALLGREVPDEQAVLARITCSVELAAAAGADVVIENVTEDAAVKRPVYQALDQLCRAEVVFAANTSAIPIGELASFTGRADRVVGIHFMNPPPLKRAAEVIRGPATSEATLAVARQLLGALGKRAIVVGDAPGFVSNRVLMLMLNEAMAVVHAGTASAADVDRVFTDCIEHRMGPLATADLIGLDTVLRTLAVLHARLGDDKFRPSPLLVELVGAGRLGRKSGHGFFRYPVLR